MEIPRNARVSTNIEDRRGEPPLSVAEMGADKAVGWQRALDELLREQMINLHVRPRPRPQSSVLQDEMMRRLSESSQQLAPLR